MLLPFPSVYNIRVNFAMQGARERAQAIGSDKPQKSLEEELQANHSHVPATIIPCLGPKLLQGKTKFIEKDCLSGTAEAIRHRGLSKQASAEIRVGSHSGGLQDA